MKFIVSVLLTMLLSFTACYFLPWWSIALTSFIVALFIPQSAGKSFITGFIALFLLWSGLSFWISLNNEHILAQRVSVLVLKMNSPFLLMIVTGIIGGLISAFGAMTGSLSRTRKKYTSRAII